MAVHNELGKLGEQLAANYLVQRGYEILVKNYRFDKAEIDIIARHQNMLVVVEVKTRNSAYFGDPQSFVTPGKIKLLVKAANEYAVSNDIEQEVRFDIISVLKNNTEEHIEHFPAAFYHF